MSGHMGAVRQGADDLLLVAESIMRIFQVLCLSCDLRFIPRRWSHAVGEDPLRKWVPRYCCISPHDPSLPVRRQDVYLRAEFRLPSLSSSFDGPFASLIFTLFLTDSTGCQVIVRYDHAHRGNE